MPTSGGPQGTPQATIHSVFNENLEDLKEQAGEQYAAFVALELRPWEIPAGFDGDLLDPAVLHLPFDRTAINTNYEAVMQQPTNAGTVADMIALKLQLDLVAVNERAFRVRHATLCRSLAHAMARRRGQGLGRVYTAMQNRPADAMRAGGVAP